MAERTATNHDVNSTFVGIAFLLLLLGLLLALSDDRLATKIETTCGQPANVSKTTETANGDASK